jgi:hypothetical protein
LQENVPGDHGQVLSAGGKTGMGPSSAADVSGRRFPGKDCLTQTSPVHRLAAAPNASLLPCQAGGNPANPGQLRRCAAKNDANPVGIALGLPPGFP